MIKKIFMWTLSLSMLLMCSFVTVQAKNDYVQNYSIETYTVTQDKGIGDYGYVTCTVKIDHNIQSGTNRVASVSVTPHFNSAWPLLMMVGTPSSTPASGEYVSKGGYVTVHFQYGMRFIGPTWSDSCQINI